jgi:citrate/tricarballylate utilization protein
LPQLDRTPIDDFLAEAQRQVSICNGCRYCEGYCAVFPALERLPVLGEGDLTYLANLCHDCRACYQACMYAPPHEFAVEIPLLMSTARERSYRQHARPRLLARLFDAGPLGIAALTLLGTAVFVLIAWVAGGASGIWSPDESTTSFYDVIPYAFMAVPILLLSAFVGIVLVWGVVDYWRTSRGTSHISARDWLNAARDVATLKNMRGGGQDCFYPDAEEPTAVRRRLHHFTAYGFLLAFASTTLAAFYEHVVGDSAPYPYLHPVVLLGLAGGIGMVIGTRGLLWHKRTSAPLASRREKALNWSFLLSLQLASVTGLLLLFLRDTGLMGALLVVHLGTVVALYLTAPYGKFVHVVYRSAAVLRSAAENAADEAQAAAPIALATARARARAGVDAPAADEAAQVEAGTN